jgi:hypothetical protein
VSAAGYFLAVANLTIFGVEVDFLKVGGLGCERVRVVLLLVGVAAGFVRELRGVETERSENFKVLDGVSSTEGSGKDCVEDVTAPAALVVLLSLLVVVISLSFRFFDGDAVSWQEGFSPSSSKSDLEEGRVPGLDVFANC